MIVLLIAADAERPPPAFDIARNRSPAGELALGVARLARIEPRVRGNGFVCSQDNKRRVARWQLEKAIRASGLRMAYAISICKTQYRCGLEDATTAQLWQLVYTIRNRAAAKRKQQDGDPF